MGWTEGTSKLSMLLMASSCPSAAPGAEVLVEVIEDRPAVGDALLVLRIGRANSRDEASDACRLLASELRLLQVDVMDDLGNGMERRIGEARPAQEDLEAAAVSFMGDYSLDHIDSQLS